MEFVKKLRANSFCLACPVLLSFLPACYFCCGYAKQHCLCASGGLFDWPHYVLRFVVDTDWCFFLEMAISPVYTFVPNLIGKIVAGAARASALESRLRPHHLHVPGVRGLLLLAQDGCRAVFDRARTRRSGWHSCPILWTNQQIRRRARYAD